MHEVATVPDHPPSSHRPIRTNYVLIDFENVRPESLELLQPDHFMVIVFVGASQAKLPFEVVAALQRLGDRAGYIKISGNGTNALDFHIAYYIGRIAAADPSAYFHVISRDTGFDPLIQHLRSNKVHARRSETISEIPLVKEATATSAGERLEVVQARLERMKDCKPRTVQTLSSTISFLCQKQINDDEIAALIDLLARRGFLSVAGTRITYALPSDNSISS